MIVSSDKEYDFIYHDGCNLGTVSAPRKVIHCVLLSKLAKEVYLCLLSFGTSAKHGFDKSKLLAYLMITEEDFKIAINELESAVLVETTRELCRLLPISESPVIKQSEFILEHVLPKYESVEDFITQVKMFKGTTFFGKSEEDVTTFFSGDIEESLEEEIEEEPKQEVKISRANRLVKVSGGYDSTQKEGEEDKKPNKKRKPSNYLSKGVGMWGVKEFIEYFNDRYNEITKLGTRPVPAKTQAQLKNLIANRGNNELVREYMDIFLENGNQFDSLDLHTFCMSWIQTKLDTYKLKGNFGYKKKSDDDGGYMADKIKKLKGDV